MQVPTSEFNTSNPLTETQYTSHSF